MSDEQMPNITLTPNQWEWLKANEQQRNADANVAHRQSIAASLVAAETMRSQEARYLSDLRDSFAMSALIAIPNMVGGKTFSDSELACEAYNIADAMMKDRTNG